MQEMIPKNYQKFEDLKISTRTIMVYTNIHFDVKTLFANMPITYVEPRYTKKKKNVDKKCLVSDCGSIINVQNGDRWRGINVKKVKKHWCAKTCRLMINKGEKEIKKLTVIEEPIELENDPIKGKLFGTKYFCTNCKIYYTLKDLEKIPYFLNQLTIVLSLGSFNLNIMMFDNNFKIAGCKTDNDAIKATEILWQNYIKPQNAFKIANNDFENLSENNMNPRFVFKLVMMNVDFKLDFPIDRHELNLLMNSEKYNETIKMSQCESTAHSSVNIKLFKKKPINYEYKCLVIPLNNDDPYITTTGNKNPYKPQKKRKTNRITSKSTKTEPKYTTFIVFSSSKIILSGKYEDSMKVAYNFFIEETFKNKNLIEEKIKEPQTDFITYMKQQKQNANPI